MQTKKEETSHILPFLWMKGEDNETIGRELDQIESCGIREICLESRPHPDFCGPGWWQNLDFIMEEAKRRGMRVWILDDDKFPTGHANGGFVRHPEKKKRYLAERHMDIMGPCRSNAVLVENFMQPDGQLLGILAAPKPDGETLAISAEGILDLTDCYDAENGFVYFDLPEGAYRLFILFTTQKGGGRDDYMNLIDSDSVRVLIDEVYEKHWERYQEYFGTTIAGFFSDEPELGNVPGYPFDDTLGRKDQRLPWSAQLEERLRALWGVDFLTNLPALWYERGGQTPGIRSDYMEEMTQLVHTCFSGQLGDWCAERGVEYIGHIIEDDNAHTRMGCSIGHYFREMEGQRMAGIDVVHHEIVPGFTEPVHQWIAGDRDGEFFHFGLAKLASSAAHIQENKKGRALCEIFGNYGWAEGVSLMKWLTNHMLVRGINEFTPHAFSMKYPDPDCPPHFYAQGHNPGFGAFRILMRYMNRSAAFLSGGRTILDAAVLYHAEAEWSGGRTMYFQKPGRRLMESQLDYDVIPADALRQEETRVEDGVLCVGAYRYPCLILPYAQRLDPDAALFAGQAARDGLPVYVIDALPESDTQGNPLPENWAEKIVVVPLEEIAQQVAQLREQQTEQQKEKQTGQSEEHRTAVQAWDGLSGGIGVQRPWTLQGGISGLRVMTVEKDNGLRLMFFNESVSQEVNGILTLAGKPETVTVYDPWTGEMQTYLTELGSVPVRLAPGESLFLQWNVLQETTGELAQSQEDGPAPESEQNRNGDSALESAASTAQSWPRTEACVPVDSDWSVSLCEEGEEQWREGCVLPAAEELPNLNGPEFWPGFAGTYRYEGDLSLEKKEGSRYLLHLPEVSDAVHLWVNGTDCGYAAGSPLAMEVTDALESGENRLRIEVATTMVWKRKDGASTHLQIPASGMTRQPYLEVLV
ncbi:MAG: hypothetical protein Q4C60_04425 [Eubacteriales bacterium]|nr:hypothetical protein [Eubacteriales bacterium]